MFKKIVLGAFLALVFTAVSELGGRLGWFDFLDGIYQDAWHQFAGQRRTPDRVVLAVIDDTTLDAFKDEPLYFWSPHYAKAIATLRRAGAAAVGLDYLFSIGIESWLAKIDLADAEISRTYDTPFREALASGGVVLGAFLAPEGEGYVLKTPIPEYLYALPGGTADLGLLNLITDPDGVIRRFAPALSGGSVQNTGFTIGRQLAVRAAAATGAAVSLPASLADPASFAKYPIGFTGPPGTIPRIPLIALLAPDALGDPRVAGLSGKTVLIALEQSGVQDIHFTPYARSLPGVSGKMMTGPEVQANIVETILSGVAPRPLPLLAGAGLTAIVLGAGVAVFLAVPPWGGALAGLVLAALFAGLSYVLFATWQVLPVAGPQIGLAGCYLSVLGFRLTGEERKREKIKQMFGRYVSKEVVDVLLATGKAPDMGGETVRVTILFMDIRNFTTLSETLSPHQVLEILNAFFCLACEPILNQGGTLDKFIGDAIMAIFGAPVAYPDHERRAIRAALGMVQKVQEFRDWMETHYGSFGLPLFDIGVGLNTGPAVIGNVGTCERTEFTAIGNTVNTASRLEGLTKTLGFRIVASKETIIGAGPGVKAGQSKVTHVKGRKEPVEVFEVLGIEGEEGGILNATQ